MFVDLSAVCWFILFSIRYCTSCTTNPEIEVSRDPHYAKHLLQQSFYDSLSGTTRVSRYQKKHLPTHLSWYHQPYVINYLHLLRFNLSSLLSPRVWQSFCTPVQVLFGLPVGLESSTSCSIHFFIQSSSFCNTCPYHCNLFCCSTEIISSNPSLSWGCPTAKHLVPFKLFILTSDQSGKLVTTVACRLYWKQTTCTVQFHI